LKNLKIVEQDAALLDLNRIVDHQNRKRGIITMGLPFQSVMDVIENAPDKPDILKLGLVYPVPKEAIADFLRSHEEVKILEELDDILEKEVKAIAYDLKLSTAIYGKMDSEDRIGEYTPDKVYQLLRKTWPEILFDKKQKAEDLALLPQRPAQMCPGCGHRSAFYAIKKVLEETDITVADIGCHTLGYLPPYNMGELLMCMGASTGIGSGLSIINTNRKVVVFMGDSTFFHAGLPGIVNAVFNKHHVTMVLMENGTTAMTGHQDHAASGTNFNEPVEAIPIRGVLQGLGVNKIYETDTYNQKKLKDLLTQALNDEEFSVVIARHPCMLKFTRELQRKPGYIRKRVDIDQNACQRIHECVETFGCPTFTRFEDGSIRINPDLCIGDGSCIQTCPTSAITSPGTKK